MKNLLKFSCALLISFSLFSCDTKEKFVEQKPHANIDISEIKFPKLRNKVDTMSGVGGFESASEAAAILAPETISEETTNEEIEEAYNNYKMKTGTRWTLDEFRASISQYAVAKDNTGNYIWDETIAESFHDVYLNGDKAAPASKYVVAVLKEKLKKGA